MEQSGCNIPSIWPQKDSGEACNRGERAAEGGAKDIQFKLSCQGSVLLMHVRQFESAQLLCLDSLYPPLSMRKECIQGLFVELELVTRSDSDGDLLVFFLYAQNKSRGHCRDTVSMSLSETY